MTRDDLPDGFTEVYFDVSEVQDELGLSSEPINVEFVGRNIGFTVVDEEDQ